MTWLVEGPWHILIGGVLLEAILAIALVRSGRGAVLWAMIGVLAVTGVLLVVERLVVTERERVEASIDDAAAALLTNDIDKVLAFVSPQAAGVRDQARNILPRVTISEANIGGDLEIKINNAARPPTATARFTFRVKLKDKHGEVPYESFVREVTLGLVKEGDRWLISRYEDRSPVGQH